MHNANLLGASLLARAHAATQEAVLRDSALRSAAYSIDAQLPDGSWTYGEALNQTWIDSFHTGYNLIALQEVCGHTDAPPFYREALEKGSRFYIDHFFEPDGTVKYYSHRRGPLDAHAFAHAILCLCTLSDLDPRSPDLLDQVITRSLDLFWSGKGFFYYQRRRWYTIRIPYLRWVEAWMLRALTAYLSRARRSFEGVREWDVFPS